MSYARVKFDNVMYFGGDDDPGFWRLKEKVAPHTALPMECLWTLYQMARQSLCVPGDFWECGVDRGGSARFIVEISAPKRLRLFDTFCGMPEADQRIDFHKNGDFQTATLESVRAYIGHEDRVICRAGVIPQSFQGLEDAQIAFAHVDCDLYSSTLACCEFIFPRLSTGGVMVFDDYGRHTCEGVRLAVDEYFAGRTSVPLTNLTTGQAVVFKL